MSLNLKSLASTPSIYTFQDAILSFEKTGLNSISQSLALFTDGCVQNNGSRDCSIACQNATLVFGSMPTLHNCLLYPIIATALLDGNFDGESAKLAAYHGISVENASAANETVANIQQCLSDYCTSTPSCSKSGTGQNIQSVPPTVCDGRPNGTCYNHTNICQSVYAPVIDDIAGVGVGLATSLLLVLEF